MISLYLGAYWGINQGNLATPCGNNIIISDMGLVESSSLPTLLSPISLLSNAQEA
jgi:hypothetical protein